jgi:hypothetical protein
LLTFSAGKNGSRAQVPPRPADIIWHCSSDVKLQLRIAEETSVRQYSYLAAAAGVLMLAKASARKAAAGAAVSVKSCFIVFFPCWLNSSESRDGIMEHQPPWAVKKSKRIPPFAWLALEIPRRAMPL